MKRVEKTVFISYRRTDRWAALAVFKDLTSHGYDAFIDYDGIASGDFEAAILDNIRSRAHFVVLLTPTALERCDDPADWLRREIEAAIAERRNIVPVLLDGFEFGSSLAVQRLQGPLAPLKQYQALRIPKEIEYFDHAMERLRSRHLAVQVEAVLHQPSTHAQQVAQQQSEAASKAIAIKLASPAENTAPRAVDPTDDTARQAVRRDRDDRVENPRTATEAPQERAPDRKCVIRPTTIEIAPGTSFRDQLKDGGEGPPMVVIPAGRFLMGSPPDEPDRSDREGPQHKVVFAKAFAIGVYAVTFDEYDRFCARTYRKEKHDAGWGRGNRPAIHVSWDDAQDYCRWLTEQTGRNYRLPSEAEWEYAARAGTTTAYWWGNQPEAARLNCDLTPSRSFWRELFGRRAVNQAVLKTVPVDSLEPNPFGLYQVHGNVWEWCQDRWHDSYKGAPGDGSAWESGDSASRVVRGGAWGGGPRHCRAAVRSLNASVERYNCIGFRVCCGAPIEPLGAGSLNAETLNS